jgi:hypothetical protein
VLLWTPGSTPQCQSAATLTFMSTLATNAVMEFLGDASNESLLDGLRKIFRLQPELDRVLTVRYMVIGQFGAIPLEPGAKMGLMVRFIETGLSLVNWDHVIEELELDPLQGG